MLEFYTTFVGVDQYGHSIYYFIQYFSAFDILNFYNIYIILTLIHIGNYVKSLGLLLHFVDAWVRVRVSAE